MLSDHLCTLRSSDVFQDEFCMLSVPCFTELLFPTEAEEKLVVVELLLKKNGILGWGRLVILSLLIIETTEFIVGLSLGSSWTHSNPTLMHFRTCWVSSNVSLYIGSISSIHLPSLHMFHAYKMNTSCHCLH